MMKVPAAPSSLYIRPSLLGTEGTLGLGPSSQVFLEKEILGGAKTAKDCQSWRPGSHSDAFQALLTVLLSPVCSYYTSGAKVNRTKLDFVEKFCTVSGSTGLFARGSSARPLVSWRLWWHKDGKQLCPNPESATGGFLFNVVALQRTLEKWCWWLTEIPLQTSLALPQSWHCQKRGGSVICQDCLMDLI